MKIIDKTRIEDSFYRYLKENWEGYANRGENTLWTNRLQLPWAKIAKISFYLKEEYGWNHDERGDKVCMEIRKKYLDYKNLKNIIKTFENQHRDIKVNLEIIHNFKY